MKVEKIEYAPVMANIAKDWFNSLEDQTIKAMVHILILEAQNNMLE